MEEKNINTKPKFKLWSIISPPLIFLAVQIFIGFIMAFFMSFSVYAEVGMDGITALAGDQSYFYDTLYPMIMEIMNKYMWIMMAVSYALTLVIMLLMRRSDNRRRYKYGMVTVYDTAGIVFFLSVFVLGISAACTGNSILSLSGLEQIFAEDMEQIQAVTYSGSIVIDILLLAVLAPIAEEFIFRGVVYARLRDHFKMVPSMLASAAIFGILHGNLVQFLYAFALGIIMAYVYEKFHSILASILFHVGANLFSTLAVYTEFFGLAESVTGQYIFIAAMAVLMVAMLSFIHDRLELKVLIPATNEEAGAEAPQE